MTVNIATFRIFQLPGLAGFGRALAAPVSKLLSALRHRRELAVLARVDDRALADIGLTRTDLRDALSEPVWRDPSTVLVSRAGARGLDRDRRPSLRATAPGFVQPPLDRPSRYTV